MPLLRLDKVAIHYGAHVLLDSIDLIINKETRLGLLGRNGAGKSTLLKILAGKFPPDTGERWLRPGVRLGWLDQSLPEANQQTVYEVVAGGLPESGKLLARYHQLANSAEEIDLVKLQRVQELLEANDGWSLGVKIDTVLSQLQLPADKKMLELSGGWRKRVSLARTLVSEPDVLLLDEPTNHLDIPAIEWLEKQIGEFNGALILITHDRVFLQKVVNRVAELDRGKLYRFDVDYTHFLEQRQNLLAAEQKANELFDKKLSEEETWIRQGIKARRTRNEGRVRALEAMRDNRRQRRQQKGNVRIQLDSAERSGKVVAELDRVSYSYDENPLIEDFSSTIVRGDRIGIVGVNGSGKTTLIKILLGQQQPLKGAVKQGSKLEIAYFEQLRHQLDPEKNLIDNVCEGRQFIDIGGKRKHAMSYLGDFLFAPATVRTPVKALSGGEQNRAILAKLFSTPANVLVLDEPTNDLDIETLELLEDILLKFDGTVLLVSHDRQFMDNVVTSLMVFEGNGRIAEYVGGYSDWVAAGGNLETLQQVENNRLSAQPVAIMQGKSKPTQTVSHGETSVQKQKLSYKHKRELDSLPGQIEKLELRQTELEKLIGEPEFYDRPNDQVQATLKELTSIQGQLEKAYGRWQELENQ